MRTLCKLLKGVIYEQKEKEETTTREEFGKNLKGAFTIDTKWMGEMMFKTKIKDLLSSLWSLSWSLLGSMDDL
jgi:hypothetical protein